MMNIKLERYETYKDSDIDWIGEVPEHWSEKRLKDLAEINGGKDFKDVCIEEGGFPVYGSGGVFGRASEYLYNKPSVLLGRKGTIDKPLFVDEPFWTVDTMYFTKINKNTYSKFFYYLCLIIRFGFYQYGSAVPSMTQNDLRHILFYCPEFEEQKVIADYIDTKVIQIERKIGLLYQKIKNYQELRQSLIDENVTRGLDKSVTMKDSGIDWIGEVPEHWSEKRVKDLFVESKRKSVTGEETLLSVSEYSGVTQKKDNVKEGEMLTTAKTLVGYKICSAGDLVINIMLAWKRGLGISPFDGIVSPSYAVYTLNKLLYPRYIHYLFRSDKAIAEFKRNSTGIIESRLRLYSDKFYALHIFIPEYNEQKAIADYLDTKTNKIDSIIETIYIEIDRLKELRKSIINELVTGKIKVIRKED